jgi:hypothetical protein
MCKHHAGFLSLALNKKKGTVSRDKAHQKMILIRNIKCDRWIFVFNFINVFIFKVLKEKTKAAWEQPVAQLKLITLSLSSSS